MDRRVLSVDGFAHDPQSVSSHAFVRPTGSGRSLSAQPLMLAYGHLDRMRQSAHANGLALLASASSSAGAIELYELPGKQTVPGGLPPETRIGALVGPHHAAYGFFYRPFNRISDVVAHFEAFAPLDTPLGFTLMPGHFELIRQVFYASSSAGQHVFSAPQGVPSKSKAAIADGFIWMEPGSDRLLARVEFESADVRISTVLLPPGKQTQWDDAAYATAAAAVQAQLNGIRRTHWR